MPDPDIEDFLTPEEQKEVSVKAEKARAIRSKDALKVAKSVQEALRKSRKASSVIQKQAKEIARLSLNGAESRAWLEKLCEEIGVDPMRHLLTMLVKGADVGGVMVPLDADQQIRICTEVQSYRMAKLKALEISGMSDNTVKIQLMPPPSVRPTIEAEVVNG